MSAIYGIIDLTKKAVSEEAMLLFSDKYKKYRIDRNEYKVFKNAAFGCGIQYFTEEAENELLPIVDGDIIFTADCVIDNREELIRLFSEDEKLRAYVNGKYTLDNTISDGTLMYLGYLKWGEECARHFRGLFSYVVYDYAKNMVIMSTDHFATRCLHYYKKDNLLYFSTLFFPLLEGCPDSFTKNDRWLLDSVSLRSPVMITEAKETAVNGVYKVPCGSFIRIKENDVDVVTYYDPQKKVKTDKSITQKQANQIIRKCLTDSVRCAIRTSGEIGAQLSQGLDSSTVACIAAPMVEAMGKKLYTFTSVPLDEANLPSKGRSVYNERPGVEKICSHFPVMEPDFYDTKGRDILHDVDKIINLWELPCKSQQNAIWTEAIQEDAYKKGCRVIIGGATGNCTISAGYQDEYLIYLLTHLKLFKANSLLKAVSKQYRVSRKKLLKSVVKRVGSYYKWYFDSKAKDTYSENITRKDIGEQYECNKRLNKLLHGTAYTSMKEHRRQIYMPLANAQIGEIDTKFSLSYGVLNRDPLRNVEVIEACMSFPYNCFADNDYDRRLVRVGMEGIVPEETIKDYRHRGSQSGDNEYRISLVWDEMLDEIKGVLYDDEILRYLDKDRIDALFAKLNKDNLAENMLDARMIVDAYVFGKYVKRLDKIIN